MRRFAITTIVLLGVAAPRILHAQTAAPSAAVSPQAAQPPAAAPAAPAAPDAEAGGSLFDLGERQFVIGGRFSSIDGDPARFQRYQDMRDGLLFTHVRYGFAKPDGTW